MFDHSAKFNSMAAERKIFVGLNDIESIVLECTQCGSRSSIPPDKLDSLPHVCPQGHPWITGEPSDLKIGTSPFQHFARAIREVRRLDGRQHEIGFKMLLEFDESESKD
jgi:hypothetical protein